jgi:hypothetical protein
MLKFPRMHIAQSVVNRIINIANQVQPSSEPAPIDLIPNVPDPTAQGAAIDAAISTPPGAAAMPPGGEDAMLAASLEGASPAEAVAVQGVIDDAT